MASPQAGTYRIIPATAATLSLDVAGGSMADGSNVRLWTANYTEAQFFEVSYRTDGTAQILSRRSGKSLDVEGGSIASGANVQQWNDNDSRAQQWVIDSDGGSATYDGGSYPTYTIKLSANTGLALDVSGGRAASGQNVQIYTANGTDAQRWMLVPMPVFASGGTYELRSMLKTDMTVDVTGSSGMRGANVQLWSANGSNAQKFLVTEDTADHWAIQNVNSGMFIDVESGSTSPGANVQQWTDNSSRSQRWRVTQYGTTTIDGTECAVVTFGSYVAGSGRTLNMDVFNAVTTVSANIDTATAGNELQQRFALYPTNPIGADMPVPANLGWSYRVGSLDWTRDRRELERYYPTWTTTAAWASDSANHHEWRWRKRSMAGSNSQWGKWGEWTAWETAAVTVDGQRCWVTKGLPATVGSSYKAIQYEIQVHAASVADDGSTVIGYDADATVSAYQVPTAYIGLAGFGPEGLRINYHTDYSGGTNNISIDSIVVDGEELLLSQQYVTGLDSSGSILIPIDQLSDWIDDGATAHITIRNGTDQMPLFDGERTSSTTVYYNYGSGLTATPTISVGQGRSLTVTIPTATLTNAWLRTNGKLAEMEVNNGVASVLYPFGIDASYELFIAISSEDGDRWGVAHVTEEQMASYLTHVRPCHAWNWDGGSFLLELRERDFLETDYKVENDVETYKLNKREWDAHLFGDTKTGTYTAEGSIGGRLGVEGTREALDALIDARHVTYRSPHGEIAEVAILGASMRNVQGIWYVTVDMARESN